MIKFFCFITFALLSSTNAHSSFNNITELVNQSKGIYVGTVIDKDVYWSKKNNKIIKTKYTFAVEEAIKNELNYEYVFELTVLGGELNGSVQFNSLSVFLEIDSRYILMIKNPEAMSPFTGGISGVYQENLFSQHPSKLIRNITSFDRWVDTLQDTVIEESKKENLRAIQSYIPKTRINKQQLPAKEYDNSNFEAQLYDDRNTQEVRYPKRNKERIQPRYSYDRNAGADLSNGRIAVETLSGGVFSGNETPYDEYMLSEWNRYVDIFRVIPSDGKWAHGNGVNEFIGFPTNETLQNQGLAVWEENTLGVRFYSGWPIEECIQFLGFNIRCYQVGINRETDVALNPNKNWTSDVEYATRNDNNTYNVQQTLLHEFGHVWGLKHPWDKKDIWWDSVMNYSPKYARLPLLHSDDTAAARNAFPSLVKPIVDGLISSYTTSKGGVDKESATYTPLWFSSPRIEAGDQISFIGAFQIENVGTVTLRNPEVEVYLCPKRMTWGGEVYLGAWKYSTIEIESFVTKIFNPDALAVPDNTPEGYYYLCMYYRNSNDVFESNNSAWGNSDVKLYVRKPVPTFYWQVGAWSSCSGPCGDKNGTKTRSVSCVSSLAGVVSDINCLNTKPAFSEACLASMCPVITVPDSPQLSISTQGLNVSLEWNKVNNTKGYKLYYAFYPYKEGDKIYSFDIGNKTIFSQELWHGAAFYVAIKAYNDQGISDYSNISFFEI